MPNQIRAARYKELLADIGRLYERARRTLVEMYWKIGQRIVEVEQDGALRAHYGEGLLNRLSADLTRMYGSGFSGRNLLRMRQFYLTYPISPAPAKCVPSVSVCGRTFLALAGRSAGRIRLRPAPRPSPGSSMASRRQDHRERGGCAAGAWRDSQRDWPARVGRCGTYS